VPRGLRKAHLSRKMSKTNASNWQGIGEVAWATVPQSRLTTDH
jgi:hypothetical protein